MHAGETLWSVSKASYWLYSHNGMPINVYMCGMYDIYVVANGNGSTLSQLRNNFQHVYQQIEQ